MSFTSLEFVAIVNSISARDVYEIDIDVVNRFCLNMIRRQLAAVQEKTNVSTPLGGVGSGKERDGGMAFF